LPPPPSAAVLPPAPTPSFGPTEAELAGFWRRFWARLVTMQLWSVVAGGSVAAVVGLVLFVTSSVDNRGVVISGLVVSVLIAGIVSHYLLSRPIEDHGGTLGMRQLGLAVAPAGDSVRVTTTQAAIRTFLAATPLVYGLAVGYLTVADDDLSDDTLLLLVYIGIGLSALMVLGGLWMLVSDRHQTAWDGAGQTLVVVRHEPAWPAVAGWLIGSLVPVVAVVSVLVFGVDKLRAEYADIESAGDAVRYLLYGLPALVVAIIAIAVNQVVIRTTNWGGGRLSGRGLAQAGLTLGYSFPFLVVLVIAFDVVYSRFDADQKRTCAEESEQIAVAAESYRTLNGIYPPDLSTVGQGIYLDTDDLGDRWQRTDGPEFAVKGIGKCEGA